MKTSLGDTYYEVLQVPVTANTFEIRQAYNDACALYGEDALATYTMFDDDQRKKIMDALTQAFDTLADPVRRRDYDAGLARAGRLPTEPSEKEEKPQKSAAAAAEPNAAAGTDIVKKRARAVARQSIAS